MENCFSVDSFSPTANSEIGEYLYKKLNEEVEELLEEINKFEK